MSHYVTHVSVRRVLVAKGWRNMHIHEGWFFWVKPRRGPLVYEVHQIMCQGQRTPVVTRAVASKLATCVEATLDDFDFIEGDDNSDQGEYDAQTID